MKQAEQLDMENLEKSVFKRQKCNSKLENFHIERNILFWDEFINM